MAFSSSSSYSSGLSFQSSTSDDWASSPERTPMEMYETLAAQWWDERDWDFAAQSGDDESMTDGEEDLQFLADGELAAESADDAISWGEDLSSSDEEEEEEDSSSEEYPPVKRFRAWSGEDTDDDDEDEEAPANNLGSSDEDDADSGADGSEDGDAPFF